MNRESNVSLELASGKNKEYIIKDKLGITIGRINIIDISKTNKYCLARIKFYRHDHDGITFLHETLKMFIASLFKNESVHKINIIADEEISTRPFVSLGFTLEGIITNSIYYKSIYKNEIMFGIDYNTYNELTTLNILRLYGKRITLKILNVDSTEDMLNYYTKNKEHLKSYEPTRDDSFYSIEAQRQIIAENYKQFLNGLGACFGIYASSKLIGKVQLSNVVYGVFKSGIVGYSIDTEFQGKGYMKEALSLLIKYAFEEMGLHRIEASTLVDNIKSQRVLKGCGFQELGLNKNYLYINGKWRDHITFYKIINESK